MKQHILIIDDETSILELLKSFFEKQGYQITLAENGTEALRLAADIGFDLIILDVVLPDADGLEVLQSLKQLHPNTPVIIMTGIGFDEVLLKEAKRKGASGYVSKTLPLDKLLSEVRAVLIAK
jgi:DNA-binding response OmpR family regulator